MRNAVFVSLILLACAIPLSADQTLKSKNPYARLFEARDLLTQAQQQHAAQGAPKKKIVCGTTIIEADPLFDQKMKVTPPKDPNVRYTIRGVEPPICNPAKQ